MGGGVFSGTEYSRTVNNSKLILSGGTSGTNGGSVEFYGKDHESLAGIVSLKARDTSKYSQLIIQPSGTFTFNNNGTTKNLAMQEDVVPRSGGAVITATTLARIDDTDFLAIRGGSAYDKGAQLTLYGKDVSGYEGYVYLRATDGANASEFALRPNSHATISCVSFRPLSGNPTLGDATYKWGQIYSTNSTISTSDSRLKNTISSIDDNLLDAWETIQPKQYKFNDATESKGEQARFHTGYLAQDIQKACTDNNLDISKYGLFCYDSWEEEPEITEDVEVEKDGVKTTEKRIVQQKREKGDMYALRYEEALVVECAYLRREISKLKEELKQLKTK